MYDSRQKTLTVERFSHKIEIMSKKSLTTSFLFLIIAEVIFNISGYIIHAGLGRILGVADYGRYSLVIGFTTMIIVLFGRGIPTAMAKRMSEKKDDWQLITAVKKTAIRLQFFTITLLTFIFYFSSPYLAQIFGDESLTPLFQLSTFIIPAFALSSFHVLYFNGLKAFGAMSIMKISRGVFRVLWIIGLAYYFSLDGAFYGAIFAPLSVFFVALIIDFFFIEKPVEDQNKPLKAYPVKKVILYAGGFMAFLFFYEFFIRVDIFMIKALLHDDALTGLYNAALTIALIPYSLLIALSFLLFPTISHLSANNHTEKAKTLISQVLRLLFIFLLPLAALMDVYAQPIIVLVFGQDFAPAAEFLPLLLGGTIFGAFFYILAAIFNGAGKTKIPATIAGLGLTSAIILNLYFLPLYGDPRITAVIFSFNAFFMGIASLFFAYKVFDAKISRYTVAKVLVSILLLTIIAPYLPGEGLWFLLSSTLLFAIYIITLIFLKEFTKKDLVVFKDLKKKKNEK